MSYILDALRKSDQQRRRGGVPTLPSVPTAAAAPERPALQSYGLLGVALIAVGMAIGWLRPWWPEPVASAPIAASAPEAPLRQPAPALRPEVSAKPEAEPSRYEPPSAAPAPRRKLPATARTEMRRAPPLDIVTHPAEATAAMPEGPSGVGPPDDASQPKPMASSDLPLSILQELPAMSVAVHAYSSKPRDRLVSINNRLLREGDTLAPDLRLEQITPDGMIFTYRGYRFRRGVP